MKKSLYEFCVENHRTDLLLEWDSEKNAGISMKDVSFGSNKKFWWHCLNGHSWQASAVSRSSRHTGCPYCASRRLDSNESFGSVYPELAAEWHPDKNKDLTPFDFHCGSKDKVWWLGKCGHEWFAEIRGRTYGKGCPICSHKKIIPGINDLATTHPELVKEWHPTLNKKLQPSSFVSGSCVKVWWRCEHGHEWLASINSRCHGNGCPICSGRTVIKGFNDLASMFPAVASQWNYEKNGPLTPDQVTPFCNKKAWWTCDLGHEYTAVISSRTERGSGCPYCKNKKILLGFNDLASVRPELVPEWYDKLNGNLTPECVTSGSSKRVWWKCNSGHVWKAVIYSRTGEHCGCPTCAGSKQSPYYGMSQHVIEKNLVEIEDGQFVYQGNYYPRSLFL